MVRVTFMGPSVGLRQVGPARCVGMPRRGRMGLRGSSVGNGCGRKVRRLKKVGEDFKRMR